MQSKWLGRIGFAALVLGIAGGSGASMGCAGERDPINRVQLNALPKSFFLGNDYTNPNDDPTFYARTMVIKVPYGDSTSDWGMFTNSENGVSKIKWQINDAKGDGQGQLVGRISFERIKGTDGQGDAVDNQPNKPVAQNDGLVVYAFNIVSQFDIRRDYNSQTGEESNVIVENTTDRPAKDRDYIRVDFSKNLVTAAYDFDTMSILGFYGGGIDYAPMEYAITDPNDVDAPVLDLDNGYFDVTNKVFANPKQIDLGGGFIVPSCILPNLIRGGNFPNGNCNPNEITLRHSFKRVVDTDYEPVDWDGQRFEAYGAFTTPMGVFGAGGRFGYARDYGLVDADWHRYISRYNIWERSHAYTDPEHMIGATACKVDADCGGIGAVVGMSHCDTYNEKCTLPYADRKVKPIYWYYADGSPEMYYESTREAAEEWDTAMREAVVTAKYAECKRFTPDQDCGPAMTGNWADEEDSLYLTKEILACRRGEVQGVDPSACNDYADQVGVQRKYAQQVIDIAKMDPMVTLCHSPVSEKDPEGCGKVGTVARLGDLRFHLITAIATPETNSPWGIMSDASDPETGEKVAASVNIWTYVNDLFARGLIDTLRYINGELKTEDITDGKYIDNWVEAARTLNEGITPILSKEEREKRIAAVAGVSIEKLHEAMAKRPAKGMMAQPPQPGQMISTPAQLRAALVADLKKVATTQAAWNAPSVNEPLYQARMNLAKGSPVDAAAVTPAMQQLAVSGFGSALPSSAMANAVSIFQGLNPTLRRDLEQRLEMGYAMRGSCVMNYEATAPLGYVALGDMLQAKFGKFNPSDPPAVQAERADKMKDYVRRRAQYAVLSHEMGHSIGERHNFVSSSDAWNFRPQYWLLRTNAKQAEAECQDGDDGKNCSGPRWLDPVTQNESKNLIHMWAQSSTMEYPGEPSQDLMALGRYDFGAARMFYGDVATVYSESKWKNTTEAGQAAEDHQDDFGGLLGYRFGNFASPIHYSQLDAHFDMIEKCNAVNTADFKPGNWNEEKDGVWHPLMDGHIVTNEAGTPMKCTEPKVDFVQWSTLKDNTDAGKIKSHTADGRVRVPHGFASDDWADLGNIAVYRHDNGADIYEQMQFWQAQQEVTHIFSDYRRGRTDFSVWGAFNRTLSRYHEKMRDSAKAIALYVTLARDTVSQYNGGTDPEAFVADVLQQVATDNTVASSIAFDHFAHVFARPEPGEHGSIGSDDPVLRSFSGTGFAQTGTPILSIPNGVTGGYGAISLGGRPIENALADNKGRDYDRDFTLNVGDYYEKAFTAMLFSESADNFISASRDDFVDPRFRAVSVADVFPDGFRRWLANNLTGDDTIKGVYTRGTGTGPVAPPDLDPDGYATIGFTQWWPQQGVETCFPQGEKLTCRDPFDQSPIGAGTGVGPVVDPQVGWDQQRFAILFTLLYLPENNRVNWLDQMQIFELGSNAGDPTFENRIEFHGPDGRVFVARTYGTETLFGKTVQKGIAARMLEYANSLLPKAMDCDTVVGKTATWYVPKLDVNGNYTYLQPVKGGGTKPVATCAESRDCVKLTNYMALPKFLGEAMHWLGHTRNAGELKGVY